MLIDTSFDFRTDTPPGKDPDAHSPTLRRYHRLLWSKALPSGTLFDLNDAKHGMSLHHCSQLGEFFLSSDSVIPTFTRWGFAKAHPDLHTEEENNAFMAIAYTIGGMMVFPGNRIEGKWTINQARGCWFAWPRANLSASSGPCKPTLIVLRKPTARKMSSWRCSATNWSAPGVAKVFRVSRG